MSFATIDDLRSQLGAAPPKSDAYVEKMMHAVPPAPVLDRTGLVLSRVTGKRVLEFGASGPLHEKVRAAASLYKGVDREAGDRVEAYDLDDVTRTYLPVLGHEQDCAQILPEIILCGELLEHLSNPGHFLARLARHFPGIPVLITVPNAFSEAGRRHILTGTENVNRDHVAYYSFKTLNTLLDRHGYRISELAWYNGRPNTAEGLIVIAETADGKA